MQEPCLRYHSAPGLPAPEVTSFDFQRYLKQAHKSVLAVTT
jgi:hypothetical protein